MSSQIKKYLLIVGLFIAIVFLSVWILMENQSKTAFVHVNKLFVEFIMTKEMETQLTNVQTLRQNELDSLELELKIMVKKLEADQQHNTDLKNEFSVKRQRFLQKQQSYAQSNEAAAADYDEKIWKQLNQYVKEYGQLKGYDYIHGAMGTGNLMYANDSRDVTQELIDYINGKYSGAL